MSAACPLGRCLSASGRHLSSPAIASSSNDSVAGLDAGKPASIFERIPKHKAKPQLSQESLDLFTKLASPEDVPMQFRQAAKTWEALSRTAVYSLRHFKVSHVAGILDSCAQVSWRDDYLLCGLAEAMRCGAELRRGTVRDYSLCLQSLRRLNYCPWVGALRPVIMELRWRLRRHHWRPIDVVLALRFLAEFSIQHMPQVRAEAVAFCRELQMKAEKRLGDMRHLELAHFARALVQLNDKGGLPDTLLLERVAENFSRRASDLPLGALLHMSSSLLDRLVFAVSSCGCSFW
ncbi:P4HA1 [Symbiodinium pilosum]|uniref:P4HA1 protein n=1 Tax=Symbiodinium pilosum TaxID=2952 RepID=A0A812TJ37_SYMPI|nr:P4HA1 [Symbiodinium pilosum]